MEHTMALPSACITNRANKHRVSDTMTTGECGFWELY